MVIKYRWFAKLRAIALNHVSPGSPRGMSRGVGNSPAFRRVRWLEDSTEKLQTPFVLWCLKQLLGQIFIFGDLAPYFTVWTLPFYLATRLGCVILIS
jgi:hypothetical protein